MPIVRTLHKGRVPVHIYTDEIDHSALQQLPNIASLPIAHPRVAAMPDNLARLRSAIEDLAEIVHTLRQVICIKG